MPELRRDPLTGRWVIIAENRADRPRDFNFKRQPGPPRPCAFCEGHEDETPSEVLATRTANGPPDRPGWQVRVVPNKYPALTEDTVANDELPSPMAPAGFEALFRQQLAAGVHEVIVESPEHVERTTDLDKQQLGEVILAYRHRLRALRADDAIAFGIAFKNVGAAAGATVEHSHSQLIGLPIVPSLAAEELAGAETYYRKFGKCFFCDLVSAELQIDRRIVAVTDHFVALCPYASRHPLETWILPRTHHADFDSLEDSSCRRLADILWDVMHGIDAATKFSAYNYLIQSAPFDSAPMPHYHWRIVIIPRLTVMAGFEWGTGCNINPVAPEKAAQQLQIVRNVAN